MKYDLPALGYSDDKRPRPGFNALIDKNGWVNHGRMAHYELAMGMEKPDLDGEDIYGSGDTYDHHQDVVADHGVRASHGYYGDWSNRDVSVQLRHDSDIARQHAASFINNHHRAGNSITIDYTAPDGNEDHLVDSKFFTDKKDAIAHLLTKPAAPKTDIARARGFTFGHESRADSLIRQALTEKALVSTNNHSARSAVKSLRGRPSKARAKKPSDLQLWHRFARPKQKPRPEHEDIEAVDNHGKIKFRVLTRAHQKELFPK